jgi:hypothetical protein
VPLFDLFNHHQPRGDFSDYIPFYLKQSKRGKGFIGLEIQSAAAQSDQEVTFTYSQNLDAFYLLSTMGMSMPNNPHAPMNIKPSH